MDAQPSARGAVPRAQARRCSKQRGAAVSFNSLLGSPVRMRAAGKPVTLLKVENAARRAGEHLRQQIEVGTRHDTNRKEGGPLGKN